MSRLQNPFLHKLNKYPLAFFFIISGVFARFISLNQSLWLDEAITAVTIQKFSYIDLIQIFAPTDFHPPLYYLLLKLWTQLFGVSEISLRLPSILFSLIAAFFVYRAGKFLAGTRGGLWSAALFLGNPLMLYYSQEARMYSLMVALIAINFACLLTLVHAKPKLSTFLFFGITLACMLMTFYGSVFYVATAVLYLVWHRRWHLLFVTSLIGGTTMLTLSPLLLQQLSNSQEARTVVANWSSVLGTATIKNALLIPVKLTSGRISFEPKTLYYGLASSWLVVLLAATWKEARRVRALLSFLIVPVLLGIGFSMFTPLLQYFRFLYLSIFLSLILGIALNKTWMRAAITTGFLAWSLAYLLIPAFHREDWRTLAEQLQNPEVNQLPIFMISSASDPITYYLPERATTSLARISQNSPTARQILVLPYVADIHGVDYVTTLESFNYQLQKTKTVRGLSWQIWELRAQPEEDPATIDL